MAKTKKEELLESIKNLINANENIEVETVDYSDPNRPKTIIEVDFPILPINQIASIEGNAGKPIYQMSKWWARRRSSVFRMMLLASSIKSPEDNISASKKAWETYYANHQKKGSFNNIRVADIFMGGGTTIVEGSRLGMQMYGNDLNPVAWMVVKNELAQVDVNQLSNTFVEIEQQLKPQIMPYYSCECPRGHKGKWLKFEQADVPINPYYDELTITEPSEKEIKKFKKGIATFEGWSKWYSVRGFNYEIMPGDFNPLSIPIEERKLYRYWGPEIIYTFWAKYGPCSTTECDHRTPLISNPVIATKDLSVKYYNDYCCSSCEEKFDVELKEARLAPGEPLVISDSEKPFTIVDNNGDFVCPSCKHKDNLSVFDQVKTKNKKVSLSLILHPQWLKGSNLTRGGSVTDSVEDTQKWNEDRANNLRYIEVRGKLPKEITCPETGVSLNTSQGNIPRRSTFTCQSDTCGREQDVLTSIRETQKTGPVSMYTQQCYCPECDNSGELYNGKFFKKPDPTQFDAANFEWNQRKENDLLPYWPKSELPYGFMTHKLNGGIPNHGFTHWWKMFNPKQLLIHSQILNIIEEMDASDEIKDLLVGTFQQYLRNQNMFCFWNTTADKLEPMFSNNNYHPKSTVVENNVFGNYGRGNLLSSFDATLAGMEWSNNPYELVSRDYILSKDEELGEQISGKSIKINLNDSVKEPLQIDNGSSTDLNHIPNESFDLVITDPPFGGLLHYAELADFFYVWLRLALKGRYPERFSSEYTLKSLEAVSNPARQPDDPDGFYRRLLTEAWKEANRILKPAGILTFTFHHSADEPWIDVLESLFEAGFYLEATYPIRSDETKGEGGQFGSRTIEYDIIHVCRKRIEEPKEISWARLRKRMVKDIRHLESILNNHLNSGLTESDLQVIRRGKALEYFSKHYRNVFVEEGREFSVKEALIGINQIINDGKNNDKEQPPIDAEVMSVEFLRIFTKTTEVQRNEMQNYLRGSGMSASDFEEKNWCKEENRVFIMTHPLIFAQNWKGKYKKGLSHDLDQTLFLIGSCFDNSGINVNDTLSNPNFKMHPAVIPLLSWFTRNGGTSEIKQAAMKAHQLCISWKAKNPNIEIEQLQLFMVDEED
ncbi:DUF1156 domain-containing protein [Bacillus cereus group sp. BceL221]|uniref:DUF1156 domain-containing protein n=1 Tax=unclassified Bacillus cereus group TaxID=2750818 RepID=UPI0022E1A826|nr:MULTISPECIES: DUF1156 domain-containing protein [unclassified Bacillus cereus group]MDA2196945.1 DUF1156 domain-containing protein [Bacillus cereus group sp. Bc238]MDA2202678.1 DUF1156 domain-containing protein [Bacillus cereus group sp. Bc237]